MNRFQTFQDFLATQTAQVEITKFVANLLLAGVLSYVLGRIYTRYGNSLSNKKMFASNFVLITMTTMLIISIVKSSLALSLGLVGALSIVRFRAAIKEPEELAYLFLTIGIGLGLGANQTVVSLIAFAVIVTIIILRKTFRGSTPHPNLHLTVVSEGPDRLQLKQIVDTLATRASAVNMRRFDETKDSLEATFLVEFRDFDQIDQTKRDLRGLSDGVQISFIESKALA